MDFFVDANVVVYSATAGPYRDSCRELVTAVAEGQADGLTSTSVLEEVWHVELSGKAGAISGLAASAYTIFTPLLPVTDETVSLALHLDSGAALGANDRIHLATCRQHSIDTIVTADADFDGVPGIHRIDPLDRRSMRRLLNLD
ncbi:MAG: type II toxin-antitoxin system VapC family toxin [Actinomycetota bacterium]|nr:type II toxin-antitoxin system VapC family toxin [Actinomycetota bacterium]